MPRFSVFVRANAATGSEAGEKLALDGSDPAVDRDDLAGDERTRVGSKQRYDSLQIFRAADALQRRPVDDLGAGSLHDALGHLGREKTRRDRVYVDVVLGPFH